MKPPAVAVLLPTYNRPKIVAETIERLRANLHYKGHVQYYIGNDGESSLSLPRGIVLDAPKQGLGGNLNFLIEQATKGGFDFFLSMDDDHWLDGELNLNPHVEKLVKDKTAGWIRLMGLGAHKLKATLEGVYWRINWDSPELYITSMRPHLKHIAFHEYFGMYPKGMKLGQTEESFCHQCKDKAKKNKDAPGVLIPLTVNTESLWRHVGESWQGKGF